MTQTVTIEEAKKDISRLLERVTSESDEIVIADRGNPVAKIIPITKPLLRPRVPGIDKGLFVVPDDFNDPLPKEIEDLFYE
jgi:prevent-host-death family protein